MSEIAKEELLTRIRGLSDEEKALIALEIPMDIFLEVFRMRIDSIENLYNDLRSAVNILK